MKKVIRSLFVSLFASLLTAGIIGANFGKANSKVADASGTYSFVEETNGLDFATTAKNATIRLAVDNYVVQSGDYLALDLEGYVSGKMAFKVGLNGNLVSVGTDWTSLPTYTRQSSGFTADLKYGRWLFAGDGRGVVYFKLSEYFPSVGTISSFDILFSDGKTQSFTLHNVFVTSSTTARNGTPMLDIFDTSGALINEKVTNVFAVNYTARKSANGFQTNESLTGGVSILLPKTHVEILLDGTVNADGGGYLAYDVSNSFAGYTYFRLGMVNTSAVSFNADWYENGKSLSSGGVLSYNTVTTQYGFYYTSAACSGTILERIQTAAGYLSKIVIDCDNIAYGQLLLSNFYFISSDFTRIIKLIDLANMSQAERSASVSIQSTAEGFATGFTRNAFYCNDAGSSKPTFNNVNADTKWSWDLLAKQYNDCLPNAEKALLTGGDADPEGSSINQALARYDYIVGKYFKTGLDTSFSDFIGRNPSPVGFSSGLIIGLNNDGNNSLVIIVTIFTCSLISLLVLFVYKDKHRHFK